MLRPHTTLALLALSACAPAMTAAEHDAPYLAARATETAACDAACCERLSADLSAARAKGDDRAADDAIERVALACPDRRRGLLDPSLQPRAERSRDRVSITVAYELRLPAEDQVTWAATYLDGTSRSLSPLPGPHQVTVDLHVLSGVEADKGRLVRLTRTVPLPADLGRTVGLTVRARRAGGELRLEVTTTNDFIKQVFPGLSGSPTEGTIGIGNLSPGADRIRVPHFDHPEWKETPLFYPPSELLLSLAGSEHFVNCVGPGGELLGTSVYRAWRPPHPRLLGAALDWLRRFEYEKPDWAWQVAAVCEPFDDVPFYRSPAPQPHPRDRGLEAQFRYDHPPVSER